MPSDRNKIAQALTIEELDSFIAELVAMPGKDRTLEKIKHKAAQLGIVISLESARAFRNTTFERHLERIRLAQEVAQQVEGIEHGGNTLADASAKLLSKRIFNRLLAADDEDSAGEVDEEATSLALSRLRAGDVQKQALAAKLREVELKVKQYELREKERVEKAKAADVAMEKLRNPKSALSDEDRAAIVAKVDDILGIRVVKKS